MSSLTDTLDASSLHLLYTAHELITRQENTTSNGTSTSNNNGRPPVYKVIGLSLAIASGLFIGISFVLKKVGLLAANQKYNQEAGEGYGYLKNWHWWGGMTLMIMGEICNFVAYAFTDAILVTPLGALSVVVTTILSAIFLKERLSFVGKVGCFNCIIGSVVIVLNAPEQSAVADIQEMRGFVIAPGFLSYAGVVILGCVFIALWVGPRYGKKSMFVYLSICSLIGGLSVVATQGLGAAVIAQASKGGQFNQWFLYVLLVFVVATLLTEIVYLNKALNIFNAALVTPTYYVFFTSTTIITSAILFRGFHGTGITIATVVMGFLQICSGVVLLQLSKSAKDVPDAAVFKGDLDQVREVAQQQDPEFEPKADAIRGAASIIRRLSTPRRNLEAEEARRIREEKQAEHLEPLKENEIAEWDGLRRRKTIIGEGAPTQSPLLRRKTIHPPLGMTHFPNDDESDHEDHGSKSSVFGTVRERAQTIFHPRQKHTDTDPTGLHSPVQPVALTNINFKSADSSSPALSYGPGSFEEAQEHIYGLPPALAKRKPIPSPRSKPLPASPAPSGLTVPANEAKRQFSFGNFLRHSKHSQSGHSTDADHALRPPTAASQAEKKAKKNATEEERLGLVKGDSSRPLMSDSSPERVRGQAAMMRTESPEALSRETSAASASTSAYDGAQYGYPHPYDMGTSHQHQHRAQPTPHNINTSHRDPHQHTYHRSASPDTISEAGQSDDSGFQDRRPRPFTQRQQPQPFSFSSRDPSPRTVVGPVPVDQRRRPSPPGVYVGPVPLPVPSQTRDFAGSAERVPQVSQTILGTGTGIGMGPGTMGSGGGQQSRPTMQSRTSTDGQGAGRRVVTIGSTHPSEPSQTLSPNIPQAQTQSAFQTYNTQATRSAPSLDPPVQFVPRDQTQTRTERPAMNRGRSDQGQALGQYGELIYSIPAISTRGRQARGDEDSERPVGGGEESSGSGNTSRDRDRDTSRFAEQSARERRERRAKRMSTGAGG